MATIQSVSIGDIFNHHKYGEYEVIEITNSKNIKVRFKNTGNIVKTNAANAKNLCIKDPYALTVLGVAYIGSTTRRIKGVKRYNKRLYMLWHNMLQRCYTGLFENYKGCTVCDRWLNYTNFKEDITRLEGFTEWAKNEVRYSLDKDLKVPGNMVYSPDTCQLVPHSVNAREGTAYREFRKLID